VTLFGRIGWAELVCAVFLRRIFDPAQHECKRLVFSL